jgi:thiamine biosynthesis protein ThiS
VSTRTLLAIRVNGEERSVESGARVTDLLATLGLDPRTVAVERNGDVLRRAALGVVELAPGDRLEIVRFVQGG